MKKRTTSDFTNLFRQKMQYLSEQVNNAIQKPLNSDIREEYASNIAVALRALVTYTSSCESLAKQSGFDEILYFPLYSPFAACSLVPQYNLVQTTWNMQTKIGTFCIRDDLDDKERISTTYMNFNCWKKEAIIDFLSSDFSPLSREKVIRIVADKLGAHVDSKIEEHLYKIETDHLLPILLNEDGTLYYGDSRNLFTETIIGIAKELIFAFKYTTWKTLIPLGNSKSILYTQQYKDTYKYIVSLVKINAYNANSFFPCQIVESSLKKFKILFRQKFFNIDIIGI